MQAPETQLLQQLACCRGSQTAARKGFHHLHELLREGEGRLRVLLQQSVIPQRRQLLAPRACQPLLLCGLLAMRSSHGGTEGCGTCCLLLELLLSPLCVRANKTFSTSQLVSSSRAISITSLKLVLSGLLMCGTSLRLTAFHIGLHSMSPWCPLCDN